MLCVRMAPAAYGWWGTAAVNLAGCALIGFLWALLTHYGKGPAWSMLLITGVLGGFTTFSAFALDAVKLFEAGKLNSALVYVALSVVGGIVLCAIVKYCTFHLLNSISCQ